MKKTTYKHIMAAVLLSGAPLLWQSCTDTWDAHFDVQDGGMADQPSLYETIKNIPGLENYARVINAIGADATFASPQQLTVWAPKDLTSAQADSIINVYNNDVAEGVKREDNKAISQFLQNHIALYTRNVSSLTNDTVSMLNGKYMRFVGTSDHSGTLAKADGTEANPFNQKVICNNGLLYITDHMQAFFPNVREYLEQNAQMDSISGMIKSFDEYELDEDASVPGGVVDGKTVYLDSVTVLYNDLLSRYGYIQREDSVYTLLAPTDAVWKKEYEQYSKYFNYDVNVMNRDSLADSYTKLSILQGRFFNTSPDFAYNLSKDSICNTMYYERQQHMPRMNVYYDPYGPEGIFSGLQKVECSNGTVYIDNKGAIDPRTTFFDRIDVEAYYPRYYEIPTNSNNEKTMNVSTLTKEIYSEDSSAIATLQKTYYYTEVTAKTASAQTELEYRLPNTMSGCYYNIYMVVVNGDNKLPAWMTVQYAVKNDKGNFANYKYFENPTPVTAGDSTVANADVILKQSNNQRYFVNDASKMDTILVQSAVQFPYSGYGLDEGAVKLKVSSIGPSSSTYREKIYTRTLRLNEFILVPFETKEEAEEAKFNKDAFNDSVLEATRKY